MEFPYRPEHVLEMVKVPKVLRRPELLRRGKPLIPLLASP